MRQGECSDDIEKCRKVRAIVSNIDWDCDAKFSFMKKPRLLLGRSECVGLVVFNGE